MRKISYVAGFAMLEVLIAALIGAIGLAGVVGLQMKSVQMVSDTGNQTHAMWLANDIRNRMRANRLGADDYIVDNMSCPPPKPPKMCASTNNNGTSDAGDDKCSNEDLAKFDLAEALCGIGSLTSVDSKSSPGSFIVDPQMTITNAGDSNFSITISWSTRIGGTDAQGNTRYLINDEVAFADVSRDSYTMVFRP